VADDLLVGVGVDLAAWRRDLNTLVAEASNAQQAIARELSQTQILPDLGAEARVAGQQIIAGIREGIASGSGELQRDVSTALVPTGLTTGINRVTSAVRSSLGELSRDFAAEGSESATAYLSELGRGLGGAKSILAGFSRQITTTLQGSQGILGDLTPQAQRAGRQLVAGLRSTILRDSDALRTAVTAALVPQNISTSFRPLIGAVDEATGEVILTLGRAGSEGARALTSGLSSGLDAAMREIVVFSGQTANTLERANLLSGLAQQGERAGALLVSGVTTAVLRGSGEIQRAIVTAMVPASLPTQLRALTTAVAAETARLVPLLSNTGAEAGRGLITGLSASLTSGTGTAVTAFSRGAQTAIAGTNLLGDLTPVGERAGLQLSAGVQSALTSQSAALRTTITAAIVPANIGTSLAGLETSLTSALARFPALFQTTGTEAGGALITGITAQLRGGQQLLTGFAADVSRSLTAALTIGDTTGTGERAGRLLAGAVATGIAAEAPRVREALALSLAPTALLTSVSTLTDAIVAETATLAPQLARQGTAAGQAYIGAIEGVVTRGAASLKALSSGATVGVVVDVAPIRAATQEQQKLLAAVTETTASTREMDAAFSQIDAAGIQGATTATRTLADAQREWLRDTVGASQAAQAAWQRQRDAAREIAAESRRTADQARRDSQAEIAAREQVRAELTHDIAALGRYGATVDTTSRRARAAWAQEAQAIRRQAVEVGVSRQELARLDGIIDQTTASFREQERAAKQAANAIRAAGSATPRFGAGVVDLGGISKQANQAKAAINGLTVAGRSFQQITGRLGPALVGVAFGLESLARGGDSATAGLRTALRAVASFATFFGPTGFLVAGISAASAAILDLFSRSRDEVEETRKKFVEEVRGMVEGANFEGLQGALKKIDLGTFTVDDNLQVKAVKGLRELKAEAIELNAQMAALGNRKDFAAVQDFNRIKKAMDELRPVVLQRIKDFNAIREAINKLPTENTFKQPVITVTTSTKDAENAIRALADQVNVVRDAITQAGLSSEQQARILAKAIPLYDQIAKLAKSHAGEVSDTTNDLARMLKTLTDIDAVSIALTRRSLGGVVPDVAPVKITGIIDKVVLAAPDKLTVPVGLDETIFHNSIRQAVETFDAAGQAKILAQIFGSPEQQAAAAEAAKASGQQFARTLNAAIQAEMIRTDIAPSIKTANIKELLALRDALIESQREASNLTTTLEDVGGAIGGISSVAREIGGLNDDIVGVIDSVGRLANALGDLSKLKIGGDDGIFGSVKGLLKGIPVIGEAIASALQLGKTAFNAITGAETKAANEQIMRENTETMERLRQDLQGFGDSIGELSSAARAIEQSAILQARAGTSGFGRGFKDVEGLDKELRAAGSSIAELKRRAEELGITIVDAKGRISAQGLDALNEALQLTVRELLTFSDTLKDTMFIADARREIFDSTDAASVGQDWLAQIRKFAPAVASSFFGGADAATREGRAIFEQGIRDAFEAAESGKIDPDMIKAFGSIKDFVNFLLDADRSLDEFAETTKEATGEMVNVVKGFKDFNLERARFAATANDVRSVTSSTAIGAPMAFTPSLATPTTTVGSVTFAPTIRIDGRDKDAIEITTEVVTELRRRAKGSANPEVRKVVNLLPS
jgi:hypothetical protein